MHKVFVSFHHANDQKYKEGLVSWAEKNKVFIDGSVDMGEIPEDWDDQKIREYIRDEHLKDTTVTILLVGTETKNRKHIDWELYSSMYDGTVNKKSGIIVILLPSVKIFFYQLLKANIIHAVIVVRKGSSQRRHNGCLLIAEKSIIGVIHTYRNASLIICSNPMPLYL